jgi:uncharacterized phiE125 gp8 family phage protein
VSEYGLDILTPAATLPVSLAEAKSHLRVTHDDEDLAIQTMIAAATERFERETGMCLLETEWQLVMDAFPKSTRPIRLPKVPLVSVEAVKYVDGNGTLTTWAADQYVVTSTRKPGLIRPAYNVIWPVTRSQPDAVQVEFTAGYEDEHAVPELAKCGILLIIGSLYEHREEQGDRQAHKLPVGVERIIQLYDIGDELLDYGATEYASILYGE